MRWGYIQEAGVNTPASIYLDIETHCHALITGSSGSGKSYALLYLLGSLLKENEKVDIFFCDFKNSEDFAFLEGLNHYYSGDLCYEGILEYYRLFCEARKNRTINRTRVLIFDEYPAFINYMSVIDKNEKTKKANEVLGIISEILMLGRGIKFGVWIVTQRADASLFANGARDNFMVILGLGKMSKEQKSMVFTGEDIPNRVFRRGEGMLIADGYAIKEVIIPRIRNIYEWKRSIRMLIIKNRFIG